MMRSLQLKKVARRGISARWLAIGVLLLTVSACTPWPDEGSGGIAERRPVESSELSALADRLQATIERGSRNSYAAQTAEAELQLVRARRTWAAGFVEDYTTDYQVLEVLIRDIEAHVGASSTRRRKRIG